MWQLNNGQVTAQSLSKACSYSMERAYSIKPFYQFRFDFIHQRDMRAIYVLFTGYVCVEQFIFSHTQVRRRYTPLLGPCFTSGLVRPTTFCISVQINMLLNCYRRYLKKALFIDTLMSVSVQPLNIAIAFSISSRGSTFWL